MAFSRFGARTVVTLHLQSFILQQGCFAAEVFVNAIHRTALLNDLYTKCCASNLRNRR